MLNFDLKRYKSKKDDEEYLVVNVPLYPKVKVGFCITRNEGVQLHLLANYDKPIFLWKPYSVRIGVYDADDYEAEKEYQFTRDTFFDKLHELINWMIDMNEAEIEDCCSPYKDDFFPNL